MPDAAVADLGTIAPATVASASPRPGGGITHAHQTRALPSGRAEVSWRIDATEFHIDVWVPAGSTAVVNIPGFDNQVHGEGSRVLVDLHFEALFPAEPAVMT